MRRTFTRETLIAADLQWQAGDFDGGWAGLRRVAAEHGFVYPPAGSKDDDARVRHPSQRAIIERALDECPDALTALVGRSGSWAEVVGRIIRYRDANRGQAAKAADEWAATKARERIEAVRTRLISASSSPGMKRIGELIAEVPV